MALITIPTIESNSVTMKLVRKDSVLETMGGSDIIIAPPGTKWFASISIRPKTLANARAWMAALVQLAKLDNTLLVPPPAWKSGTGYSGANGIVNGGSQTGTSLAVTGLSASTAIALAGDYISFNNELKMLTANATTNGSGQVTFQFQPAMRTSPTNGSAVNVKTPAMTARMVNPEAAWGIRLPDIYDFELNVIEAF